MTKYSTCHHKLPVWEVSTKKIQGPDVVIYQEISPYSNDIFVACPWLNPI
jgi:hypothetical protein